MVCIIFSASSKPCITSAMMRVAKINPELNASHSVMQDIARLILASSDEDDIVLDPFMGGGSTALACINNKRNYIGFEIEQEYYEKSLERL